MTGGNKTSKHISIKTRIVTSMLIPIVVSYTLISSVFFFSLFNSLYQTAETEFLQVSQKYSSDFKTRLNNALHYLSITSTMVQMLAENGVNRELLCSSLMRVFDEYGFIDGSSVYFEPNMFDGKDAEYKGTGYGSSHSGRISYYFYKSGGETLFLPEAAENDAEFEQPYYTEAKAGNKPIYTAPFVYNIDGRDVPMFTLTYPIKDNSGTFIGAVTVDLFLEELYTSLRNVQIYKTGYLVIANDKDQVIYSPNLADIGKSREDAGLNYDLPANDQSLVFSDANSVINGKECLTAINSIYIPQLDSCFYVSASAPISEININGTRLIIIIVSFSAAVTAVILLLLFHFINKITAPIKAITSSVDKIANGDYDARINGDFKAEFAVMKTSINTMADSIGDYIKESENSLNILQNILNGLDAYIYVTVPDTGQILFINERMKAHFGIKGTGIGEICYKVLQVGMESRCEFCPCFQLDREPDSFVVWEEHSTLTGRHYRNTDCYIEWLGGAKVHLQHCVDITDLREAMNDKLEAERDAMRLKHEKDKAEAAAKAKNDFLAKMSHEIRTPMNAVVGMSELILRKDLPEDIYEHAMMIKSAGQNLLSIINDILDFSKIESGMLEIADTEYSFSSLINDVINIVRVRLIDKPVQFAAHISPNIPVSLKGDEIRIRQVLINILSNAVKYTNEGYVSLDISGELNDCSVTLTIMVSDSGIGIKKENQPKLFGDFVQICTAENRGIEGTGLGLAISRNLVRAMGGDIVVASEYEKGSVFTITLPQSFTEYKPFAVVDNPEISSVLIYETRMIYRESVELTLSDLGVRFKSVESIPELFDSLAEYEFLFISSFIQGSVYPYVSQMKKQPKIVLLTDITETRSARNTRILILPAHPLSIANILNDVREEFAPAGGASFTAPDAEVLIVDDIAANLKVAEGLLLPYNMKITLCGSGRESVRLVGENHYDLVFMDHMMPDVGGIEATRMIREREGDYFEKLPIIALTANAVSGVREMFIQNGMNDFLAKPIETIKLDALLEKWIPKEKRKKASAAGQAMTGESALVTALRDIDGLSVDRALAVLGGSPQSFERIIKLSAQLLPENIERLNSLIDENLQNYTIEVHGVKGVLNNIGAYKLGGMAYELETLARDGEITQCKTLHPDFIEKLAKFSSEVNTLINNEKPPERDIGNTQLIRESLQGLAEAIDFFDNSGALDILAEINKYTYNVEIDGILGEITRLVERFDFDSAVEKTEKLKEAIEWKQ